MVLVSLDSYNIRLWGWAMNPAATSRWYCRALEAAHHNNNDNNNGTAVLCRRLCFLSCFSCVGSLHSRRPRKHVQTLLRLKTAYEDCLLIKWLRSWLTYPLLRITLVKSCVSSSSSYLDTIPTRIMSVGGVKENFSNDMSLEWDVATSIKTLMVDKREEGPNRVCKTTTEIDQPQSACKPVCISSPVMLPHSTKLHSHG